MLWTVCCVEDHHVWVTIKKLCLSKKSHKWPSSILLPLSSWGLSCPWSLAHISWGVPCKPPVTQNKLPSLWMGQNNTEMSLFRCNWSYLGKHKSIVFIIAVAPAPQRFFRGFLCFSSLSHSFLFSRLIFLRKALHYNVSPQPKAGSAHFGALGKTWCD